MEHLENIVREHPQHTNYTLTLASANVALCRLSSLGEVGPAAAARHLETATRLYERVLLAHPEVGYAWNELRNAIDVESAYWHSLGQLEGQLHSTSERIVWLKAERSRLGRSSEDFLYQSYVSRASVLRELGRPLEALTDLGAASSLPDPSDSALKQEHEQLPPSIGGPDIHQQRGHVLRRDARGKRAGAGPQ